MHPRTFVAAASALVLLVAACGDDPADDGPTTSEVSTGSTADAGATRATTGPSDSTSSADDEGHPTTPTPSDP